ncbi:hypothetical protein AMS68_005637 [Peltaster fructicola]|uniref:Uncharacterized protein n=1 Tax=Peltaster fructicola TaxID=286661 RepID=A0A6H0Y0E1_9PEZI|nr:hypothetical protein AMS68_005637 [Peltaster fructicola]
MAPERPAATSSAKEQADFVQAFQELAKGERTATALENQLSVMEAKIEALLAEAEKNQQASQALKASSAQGQSQDRQS